MYRAIERFSRMYVQGEKYRFCDVMYQKDMSGPDALGVCTGTDFCSTKYKKYSPIQKAYILTKSIHYLTPYIIVSMH